MFCKNCGNNIPKGIQFCPVCGEPVLPVTNDVVTPISQVGSSYSKKSGKKFTTIAIIATAVAAIVAVVMMIFIAGNSDGEKDANGYAKEVKLYLDYIASKNDDIYGFLSDLYFGGEFGDFYSGAEATEIHELLVKALFKEEKDEGDMGYYYYDSFEYDNWKDFLKEDFINEFYEDMESEYGEWELNYEITNTRKLSNTKMEDLESVWEEVIEVYEESLYDDLELEREDRRILKDFIASIEDLKIEDAYGVEAKIEIDGDDGLYSEVVEFMVAKIGNEWVILDGPSLYDFTISSH